MNLRVKPFCVIVEAAKHLKKTHFRIIIAIISFLFCFVFFRFFGLLLQFNVLFLRLEKNTKMITGAHMAIK